MFHCKQCGKCCVGGAEGVLLPPDDIERLSKGMEMSKRQFKDKFTFITEGKRHLPFPCPFYNLNSHSCMVYQFRPYKCRLFPFYPSSQINIAPNPSHLENKVGVISINVRCPEGKAIASQFLKVIRDSTLYKKMDRGNTT
ncbi:YkgJ family cysteine cluster protein [Chloroflexota bacterium]